ncbi:MAG: UvrB/UvrC motif-containing protein, partial [Clostridium sp.]|nr:UvrB/UvrC motif-containing protein [Clostridium sp.]
LHLPGGIAGQERRQAQARNYDRETSAGSEIAADPVIPYMNRNELERNIARQRQEMLDAAKRMDFMEAARLRDEVIRLEDYMNTKFPAGGDTGEA